MLNFKDTWNALIKLGALSL